MSQINGVAAGYLFAFVWFGLTIWFAPKPSKQAAPVLAALLGAGLGWTLGYLVSRSDPAFKTALAGLTTLITGYVLAKARDIVEQLKTDDFPVTLVVLIFATDVIVGFLATFVWQFQSGHLSQ